MNFVFLSPHFPPYYRLFCQRLNERGVRVLGIGDAPKDQLSPELLSSLTDYYQVESLLDYDQLLRALGYFIHQFGRIDRLDSLNEYFLEQEARLRTDFNIPGLKAEEAALIRRKSHMKQVFAQAGIPTGRWAPVGGLQEAQAFVAQVGYPVLIKRDLGGGGGPLYAAADEADLFHFFSRPHSHDYIIEEYVPGPSVTFDGIVDQEGHVLYAASHLFPYFQTLRGGQGGQLAFFSQRSVPEDLGVLGRRVLRAFAITERFFHLEFIRLDQDKPGLGQKGDLIALQVNMRAPGGMITDLMQFASNVDVYGMWADMIVYGRLSRPMMEQRFLCGYASRVDGQRYVHSHEDILRAWEGQVRHHLPVPAIMARAMGNYVYLFGAEDEAELARIAEYIHLPDDKRKLPEQKEEQGFLLKIH